jgi:hypothetical protein
MHALNLIVSSARCEAEFSAFDGESVSTHFEALAQSGACIAQVRALKALALTSQELLTLR